MRHSEPHAFWFAPTTYGSQYQWWMLVDWNEVAETHNHRGDWFCVYSYPFRDTTVRCGR